MLSKNIFIQLIILFMAVETSGEYLEEFLFYYESESDQ
jgi:hypothetical protein